MGIKVLAEPFLDRGYGPAGQNQFSQELLSAMHFELPVKEGAPRIFISEMILENFSSNLQDTIRTALDLVDQEKRKSKDLIFAVNLCIGIIAGSADKIFESRLLEIEGLAFNFIS